MVASNDPKGYYARLGVTASAEAETIKRAYRRLAKELHPDVNKGNSPARFQEITEAYNVLSDPELRRQYDALQYEAPESAKHADQIKPICCSHCGKITAQPRSIVFHQVISIIFLTTRTPVQGIFCSACARKLSWKASALSAVFGWWGFPWGPIWTIGSIVGNATGGQQSRSINEKLLWYSTLAILAKGRLFIAYALAQEARKANDPDIAIGAVRLMDRLQSAGVPSNSPMLKDPWASNILSVVAHMALVGLVPGAIVLAANIADVSNSINQRAFRPVRPIYSYPPPLPVHPIASSPPISMPKETSNNIPKCLFPPGNGEILERFGSWNDDGHQVEVRNGSTGNAIVKLRNASTGKLLVSFFVEREATASIKNLPDGSYRLQFAFGGELGSDCRSFGQITSASQSPDIEELYTRTTPTQIIYSTLTYTLFAVPHGNFRPQTIDVATFNAD